MGSRLAASATWSRAPSIWAYRRSKAARSGLLGPRTFNFCRAPAIRSSHFWTNPCQCARSWMWTRWGYDGFRRGSTGWVRVGTLASPSDTGCDLDADTGKAPAWVGRRTAKGATRVEGDLAIRYNS